jgi:hypothetical protein
MIGIGLHIGNRVMGGGGGFDVDAQAFFDRVTVAGGTLTTTEQNATNQLVLDMKSAGIWSAMKAIYPMVGASAAACAQNLKSSSFTGSFTSGWTFASTGVTGNGTSSYMDPGGFNSAANLSLNSAHVSYYSRTDSASQMVMAGTQSLYVLARWTNYHANNSAESNLGGINTGSTTAGFFMSNRTIGTEMKYQINGSIQTDSTSTAATASISSNKTLLMGCQNSGIGIRFNNDYSTAFYSLGDGLTDTQASNLYTAVQAFQTTLSRQV